MKTRMRVALVIAALVAATVVASAMAFAGRDAPATRPEARSPAALAEQVRVERRESFLRPGCEELVLQNTPDV